VILCLLPSAFCLLPSAFCLVGWRIMAGERKRRKPFAFRQGTLSSVPFNSTPNIGFSR
jgi:hypothetical protein